MKRIIFAVMATAIMTGSALAAGDMQKVRMGTEGAYPPYNFVNDKGEIDGFEREVGDKLCELAKLDCTWVKNDWDSIIQNLVSGNYDTIIAGMSITAERDKVIDFTQEYFPPDPSAYVALKGASADAVSGIVAAQKATIQASYIAASKATVVEFATPDETIAAVRSGEADAVLADRAYLEPFVKESKGELIFVGDPVEIGGGIGVGIRESDGELKGKLDAAIDTMKKDGSLSKLIAKWFEGRVVKF
ncbi:MAG: transporter substrate-binding domain-containing protein [Hyphomicrobiales bacterium]|nr:transporter substrate-binding domain-containing protein [Hyphomicrobiales bacterium]